MEWLFVVIIVVAVIMFMRSSQRARISGSGSRRAISQEDLAAVKRAADEDVTQFGEELQRLDAEVAGRDLDEGTRADYERALNGYEAAKESVGAVSHPDEIRHVTEILEDGRYAVACVRTRVAGEPLPERRSPCFFNPQHGPSVRDVLWTPPGGTPREVPACALDAERVVAGAEPDSRQVMVGAQRVPYWQAGPAFSPWAAGYFGAFGMMNVLFMGTMMGAAFGTFDGGFDGSYDEGYDQGYDAGSDAGSDAGQDGGDAGGFDGGDGGGFDGGGFDGGGFDGGGF